MNQVITANEIKQLCGTVSYKRGLSFYKANKVEIIEQSGHGAKGIVHGTEPFYVEVERISTKKWHATCSCPKLAAVKFECQHVAAVLLALQQTAQTTEVPSNPFIDIFQQKSLKKPTYQAHFESRDELEVGYILSPYETSSGQKLWKMDLQIDHEHIASARDFLLALQEGKRYQNFDSKLHCHSKIDDAIFGQLMAILRDESLYGATMDKTAPIVIPPMNWRILVPLLQQATNVQILVARQRIYAIQFANEVPPFTFQLSEENEYARLKIARFDEAELFEAYQLLVMNGKFYALSEESASQIAQVKKLVQESDEVIIATSQLEYFIKQIVPVLKRLGTVKISPKLQRYLMTEPLVAHLYLDRLRGRLLAGMEFHYGKTIIQPLDQEKSYPHIFRDEDEETQLLEIMKESGFTETEGGFYLQNDELEYHFLTTVVPQLQKRMKIYATMAIKLRITKDAVKPRIRVKAHTERTNWVEFKFELEGIRDEDIRAVLRAIQLKQKFYRLKNGSLMSLETREIEEIQRFLSELPVQLEDEEVTLNLPITESLKFTTLFEDSDAFLMEQSFAQITHQLSHPETLVEEVPESLKSILRPYQVHGYQWMKLLASFGFGGVLADDMGLGKTLQSISYIVSVIKDIRTKKAPILVVCPTAVTYNWLQELLHFAPELNAVVVDGAVNERKELLLDIDGMDVIITSYQLIRKDIAQYEQLHFHTIFFDEAQAFKNPVTQTAKSVRRLNAGQKFALTGTPMENATEELWSIYRVIFPQLFGTIQQFSELQSKDIARRVRPFLLRRMKEDVLEELPEKIEQVVFSNLTVDQKKLYAAYLSKLRHDTLKHLDRETFSQNKVRILAGITRLRQLCCHPSLFIEGYKGSAGKFEQLLSLLQEAKLSGRRVLVFSQFTQMLQLIAQKLNEDNASYFYLDGQTPSQERVDLCDRFNDGECDVFLISLKAGGTGLNLTGADTVILYDLWWNPAVEEQAADRAHRMGQKRTVEVVKMIARGTIEDKMHELQQKKRDMIATILDENPTHAASLTEQDIKEILMI